MPKLPEPVGVAAARGLMWFTALVLLSASAMRVARGFSDDNALAFAMIDVYSGSPGFNESTMPTWEPGYGGLPIKLGFLAAMFGFLLFSVLYAVAAFRLRKGTLGSRRFAVGVLAASALLVAAAGLAGFGWRLPIEPMSEDAELLLKLYMINLPDWWIDAETATEATVGAIAVACGVLLCRPNVSAYLRSGQSEPDQDDLLERKHIAPCIAML